METVPNLVSIIIVNYNTEQLLEDCILSIQKYTHDVHHEIIVVDNDSREGSLSTLITKFPQVRFHFARANLGFGVANNLGASIARGEYLFFLNPDTLLLNDAVLILYSYLKEHPQVGICGGNLYKGDMTPAVSFHILDFYLRELRIVLNRTWEKGFNNTGQPLSVNVIMGAALFISRSLFLQLNGFDKDFFMYFEEVELCGRVKKAGYTIMSVPDAKIIHLEGGAAENKNDELNKWSYREHWYSKWIFFHKTKGKLQTNILYAANCLKMNLAMLTFKILGNKRKVEYWTTKKVVIQNSFQRYKGRFHL